MGGNNEESKGNICNEKDQQYSHRCVERCDLGREDLSAVPNTGFNGV
jgi:hypothetical protein